jgi:hypothetical protein
VKSLGFYTKLKNLDVGFASKFFKEIRLHFLSIFGWILRCGVRGGVRATETQMLCTGLLKLAITNIFQDVFLCLRIGSRIGTPLRKVIHFETRLSMHQFFYKSKGTGIKSSAHL